MTHPIYNGLVLARSKDPDRLATWTAAAVLAIGVVCFANALIQLERPFAGFVVGPHGVVGFRDRAGWTGPRSGLRPGDRVLSVDGVTVGQNRTLAAVVGAKPIGSSFTYRMEDGRGLAIASQPFTLDDLLWVYAAGAVGGLLHLALGYLVVRLRPDSPAARAHWRFCIGIALFFFTAPGGMLLPVSYVPNYLVSAWLIDPILELATTFPVEMPRARRRLRFVGRLATAGILALLAWGLLDPAMMSTSMRYGILPSVAAFLVLLLLWAWHTINPRDLPETRRKARLVAFGMGLSLGPSVGYTLLQAARLPLPALDLSEFTIGGFPACITYAILRHDALDMSRVLRQLLLYTLLTALLAGIYAGTALGVGVALGEARAPGVGGFAAAIALTLALRPLYDRLRLALDRLTARPAPLDALHSFGQQATGGVQDLEAALCEAVQRVLGATWASVGHQPPRAAELTVPLAVADARSLYVGPRLAPRPYGEAERTFVTTLATQAALGLEQVRLAEEGAASRLREEVATALATERAALVRQLVHDLATDMSAIAVAMDLARAHPESEAPWATMRRGLAHMEAFLADKRAAVAGVAPARRVHALPVVLDRLDAPGHPRPTWVWDAEHDLVALGEVELGQVVTNLVDNALKFSPPGGQVRLHATNEGGMLCLTVHDEGPGIPPELLDTPGDGRRGQHRHPGSGLGLVNVKAIVERAGGRLTWRNEPGGAAVGVSLPLLPDD